jgi:hypothetical protein
MLDFYVWVLWKSWTLKTSPAIVPLFTASGLSSQLGTREYPARRFRQLIGQWLRRVKAVWPECPAEISTNVQCLVVRSSKHCPAVRGVERRDSHRPLVRAAMYGKGAFAPDRVYSRT